jgi:hypothetical protein
MLACDSAFDRSPILHLLNLLHLLRLDDIISDLPPQRAFAPRALYDSPAATERHPSYLGWTTEYRLTVFYGQPFTQPPSFMSFLQHASSTLSSFLALPSEVALSTVLPTTPLQISSTGIVPSAFSAVLTATATATSTANSTDDHPGAENGECRLLGPASLFIQAALGALALLSLVYKRWRERPQRPLKIWAFDASKQVVGSVLLHIANLLMSMLSSGQFEVKAGDYQANPCSFYLLNLAIDVSSNPTLLPRPLFPGADLVFALRRLQSAFPYSSSFSMFCTPPLLSPLLPNRLSRYNLAITAVLRKQPGGLSNVSSTSKASSA